MILDVLGTPAHGDTGGAALDPGRPASVFIHGAMNDHTVWRPQVDALAHEGGNVLALDLTGHGRSAGPALDTVEAMADWVLAALDAAGIGAAALIGHSMGSLIALEASLRAPGRIKALALLGATVPMKVSDALLASARDDEAAAIEMVAQWSHVPDSPARAQSAELMRSMAGRGLLHTDLDACRRYANGEAAARAVQCPTLLVIGSKDKMTPPKSTALLTGALAHASVVQVEAGHQMMAEQPGAVTDALRQLANCSARV